MSVSSLDWRRERMSARRVVPDLLGVVMVGDGVFLEERKMSDNVVSPLSYVLHTVDREVSSEEAYLPVFKS